MTATTDETQDIGGQNPKHDEGYKYILSNAANFLHFLKKYFPAPWTADISVDDLEPVKQSKELTRAQRLPTPRRRADNLVQRRRQLDGGQDVP